MAAVNNLFPLVHSLRLSLVPYKSQLELNNSFRPGQAIDPLLAVVDFVSGVHAKEMFISNPTKRGSGSQPVNGWNFQTVSGGNIESPYFANRSSRAFQLGNVVSTTPNEWIQLQGTIYGIYAMLDPLSVVLSSAFTTDEQTYWMQNMGLIIAPLALTGADGTPLVAPPVTTAQQYADNWNNIKVPYDKNLGYDTPYVFGVETSVNPVVLNGWPVRVIGNVPVDQQEAIDYWNHIYPSVVSR